jgi:alanine racemase
MNPVAQIDVAAFRANIRHLAAAVAPTPIMVMLKADAYGHGMLRLARPALEAGASALGTLDIPAALALRDAGIEAPLFAWLHGSGTDFAAAAAHGVDVGISSSSELDAALARPLPAPLAVHLKIDTGLHRNGASPDDWPALVSAAVAAQRSGRLRLRGIWSHLADAGEEADRAALAEFRSAVEAARRLGATPQMLHVAASSAGLYLPEARLDIVRFGIAAYGVSPFDDRTATDLGVVPVMTLSAPVTAVRPATGEAQIGAGWADGVHPTAAGRASVLVRGARRPVTAIDVDTMTVAGAADVAVGDDAVLFGSGEDGAPTPADWAEWASTVGDEILTRVGTRVPRRYLDAEVPAGTR